MLKDCMLYLLHHLLGCFLFPFKCVLKAPVSSHTSIITWPHINSQLLFHYSIHSFIIHHQGQDHGGSGSSPGNTGCSSSRMVYQSMAGHSMNKHTFTLRVNLENLISLPECFWTVRGNQRTPHKHKRNMWNSTQPVTWAQKQTGDPGSVWMPPASSLRLSPCHIRHAALVLLGYLKVIYCLLY